MVYGLHNPNNMIMGETKGNLTLFVG